MGQHGLDHLVGDLVTHRHRPRFGFGVAQLQTDRVPMCRLVGWGECAQRRQRVAHRAPFHGLTLSEENPPRKYGAPMPPLICSSCSTRFTADELRGTCRAVRLAAAFRV